MDDRNPEQMETWELVFGLLQIRLYPKDDLSPTLIRQYIETPVADRATVYGETSGNDELDDLAERSREELITLFAKERIEHQQRLEAKRWERDAKYFFNRPDAEADFRHWFQIAYWKIDEAVALSLGRDPEKVNPTKLGRFKVDESPLLREFARRHEVFSRASIAYQLRNSNSPGDVLEWADSIGLIVDARLLEAAERWCQPPTPWKAQYEAAATRNAELEAELAEARSVSGKDKNRPQSALTRERNTLLKLVMGLAISSYSHDARAPRTTTASAIRRDLDSIGMPIDEDTIRKLLTEAAQFAPDPPVE